MDALSSLVVISLNTMMYYMWLFQILWNSMCPIDEDLLCQEIAHFQSR